MKKLPKILLGLLLVVCTAVLADDSSFTIHKIHPQGLHYISADTFFNYLPVKEGDKFDASKSAEIIKNLYKSGFFADISLYRDGNDLIIKLKERPVISTINLSGNKKITTKQIRDVMRQNGFYEGQIFNDGTLTALKNSLYQQYYSLGFYNVAVDSSVTPQKTGGILVNITVTEGITAKIKEIKIVGNDNFSTKKLLKNFSLSTSGLFSWYTHNDQYSREKLDADLESLKSFYYDNGYLEFNIDSALASITPDKSGIYITVHITEGPVYHISNINLSGNLLGFGKEISKLIDIKPGNAFSRAHVIEIDESITRLFGDSGYALAAVNPETRLDKDRHLVAINFIVTPGTRVYVRKIDFSGNTKTAEYVLRREMRQIEGGLFSTTKVEQSKRRLLNLGYIKNVNSSLKPIPESANEVDLQYDVTEESALAASLNFGYSDVDNFIVGGGITDNNFLGTGKRVGLQANVSSYNKVIGFNYLNPYFTENNISFGFNVFTQLTDSSKLENVSEYTENNIGATATYGFPLSDYGRLSFGYGYTNTKIDTTNATPIEISSFLKEYGDNFNLVNLYSGYSYTNLDRAVFPTKGFANSLSVSVSVPVFSDNLEFYKTYYELSGYYPLNDYFVALAHGFAGYGNSYGSNKYALPFFENFFAGGLGSVRGYETNTLGPHDINDNAIGGNLSVYGTVGIVFPNLISDSIRTSAFFDAGNVYEVNLHDGQEPHNSSLRYSAGVQVEWHSFLPLIFSIAEPINKKLGDHTQIFQFTIGTSI